MTSPPDAAQPHLPGEAPNRNFHHIRDTTLNQVERFFDLLTEERIRRGVFHSVAEAEAAIHDYLKHHNANPRPFV